MSQESTRVEPAPTRCPFCASEAIAATGPKLTAASYWRCDKCGQLWHPARLRSQWEYGMPRR
jgi:transposase-like protein